LKLQIINVEAGKEIHYNILLPWELFKSHSLFFNEQQPAKIGHATFKSLNVLFL
jgi:hypothetical protein